MKYSMSLALLIQSAVLLSAIPSVFAQDRDESSSEENPIDELPETYVTATANPTTWLLTPGSGTLMKQSDFIALGGADFGDLVKYDPTVSAPYSFGSSDGTFGYGQTGYAGYNIRGMEGNRILMLVDGIRQPEQFVSTSFGQDGDSAGGAGRNYYDPAMFEATEILKGSASALYGSDALGGVVAYRTPEASDFFADSREGNFAGLLRSQYFSHNESFAGQGFWAFRGDDVDLLFGYAGRWGNETENNGSVPPNPVDFDSQSYLLKFGYQAGQTHELGLTLEHFSRDRFVETFSASQFINTFDKEILNWEHQERSRDC